MLKGKRRILLTGALLLLCFVGYLYVHHDIGVSKSALERDARSSQNIADWPMVMDVSDTMAVLLFYVEDGSDHTFSVYVNRPGLSFGYFFRAGGSIPVSGEYIAELTVEGCAERAFISMNEPKVARIEIDDGNTAQIIEVDSGKPFAILLPLHAGIVTFYDIDGNTVQTYNAKL